jgi:hypothetical protein
MRAYKCFFTLRAEVAKYSLERKIFSTKIGKKKHCLVSLQFSKRLTVLTISEQERANLFISTVKIHHVTNMNLWSNSE